MFNLNKTYFIMTLGLTLLVSACGKDDKSKNLVKTNPISKNWNNTNSTFSAPPYVDWNNSYWWNNNQNFYDACQGFSQNYYSSQTPNYYWDPSYGGLGVNYYNGLNDYVYNYNGLYYYINQNGYCNNSPQTYYNNYYNNGYNGGYNGGYNSGFYYYGGYTGGNNGNSGNGSNSNTNRCGGTNQVFSTGHVNNSFHVHNGAESHIDIPGLPSSEQEYFLIYKGNYSGSYQTDEILYVERSDGSNRTRIKDLNNTTSGGSANTIAETCYVSNTFCLSNSMNRIHLHSISGTHSSQMTGYEITTTRPTGMQTCN